MASAIFRLLIACVACLTMTNSVFSLPSYRVGKPQKFADDAATTENWLYYRHQSTVLHAYHTLLSNGMPKENIITMIYDDIAHHPDNREPGVIRNHPFGPNLYTQNLTKSYTGDEVNAKNFLAVLTGDSTEASGPVIKSGPRDTIFVYICGIGAYRAITFPSGAPLPADAFVDTLKTIRSQEKAKKIFVMLDVAFAASLVHGLVPRHDKIFVSTATHFKEFPSSVYCYVDKRICYSTLYGAAWTQRSDRLRQMRTGGRETLFDQFNSVRTQTVRTHVNVHGEIEMGQSRLKDFLAYKLERKLTSDGNCTSSLASVLLRSIREGVRIVDVDEETHEEKDSNKMVGREKSELHNIMNEYDILPAFMGEENETDTANMAEKRKFVSDTVKQILHEVGVNFDSIEDPSHTLSPEVIQDYEKSVEMFHSICLDINENVYAQQFLIKLAKICEMRIPLEKQLTAMRSVCSEEHRRMTFAH